MRAPRVIPAFRSFLARERLLERFPPPPSGALRVAAGYPAPYRVGMANLGFHFLYGGLRRSPRLAVERFFSDTAPLTLETGARLSSASALFFSVSYEEDYLNVVRILHRSGIPALRKERFGGPIVIAGGPAVSANPAPLSSIADAIALGEGEGTLEGIVRVLGEEGAVEPREALPALAALSAVLVPGVSGPGVSYNEPIAGGPFARSIIVTPENVFPDMMLVESGRGCPGACAFCLATSLYRPFRFLRREALEEMLSRLDAPVRKVGLVSPAVAANPESPIVALIYGFTYLFLFPFEGLVASPTMGSMVLELSSMFAILIYGLIAWAVERIVWLIFYRPRGPVVAVTETSTSESHTPR